MSDHHDKTGRICKEILDTCAVSNLRKLSRLTTAHFNEKIKTTGMKTTQFCVLFNIGRYPGKSLSFYAEELGMDLSTLTRSLDNLSQSGFVVLQSGKRREKRAVLTVSGAEKIEQVYPYWLEAQSEFIKSFGEEQWQSFLGAMPDRGASRAS
jgi:DNA-binding MarR family transcriptional regulator